MLTRWGEGLPPERIHVVTVPAVRRAARPALGALLQAFGIDPTWAPEESDRRERLDRHRRGPLLRKLNRRLKRAGLEGEDYRRIVRELMVHDTLAHREGMTKATLPPAAFPWATEIAEEWIEWIEGSGVDVVGDVEDLRPVRPPEDADWANPDRPRRADMVDAALDALVAVTLEAAQRPDPHDQIGAKIGRAARRLRGQ